MSALSNGVPQTETIKIDRVMPVTWKSRLWSHRTCGLAKRLLQNDSCNTTLAKRLSSTDGCNEYVHVSMSKLFKLLGLLERYSRLSPNTAFWTTHVAVRRHRQLAASRLHLQSLYCEFSSCVHKLGGYTADVHATYINAYGQH